MSLGRELKTGVIITFLSKYSNVLMQLIVGMILSRLLSPVDFGNIAILMVFITFINVMSNSILSPAIIQLQEIKRKDVVHYFHITLLISLFSAVVFYFFSKVLSKFYDSVLFENAKYYIIVLVFFSVVNIVPFSLNKKNKLFKKIGLLQLLSSFISGIIAVLMAIYGFGFESLIVQAITNAVVMFVGNVIISSFLSYFKGETISLNELKVSYNKIKSYSFYNVAFDFVNYFSRNLDNILIGKYLGAAKLGYYDKGYTLMLYPVQNLSHVLTPVMHPILAQYQTEEDKIFKVYNFTTRVLCLIALPLSVFLYFNSYEIILIMYGDQWLPSVDVFKVLSISVVLQIVSTSAGSIMLSTNNARLYFINGFINSIFMVAGILYGVLNESVLDVAYGVLFAFSFNFIQLSVIMYKFIFNTKVYLFYKNLINPLIIGAGVFVSSIIMDQVVIDSVWYRIITKSCIAFLVFLIGLYFTKEYKEIKRFLSA